MYWSHVSRLAIKPVSTVDTDRLNVERIRVMSSMVRLRNMPLATMEPPNVMAHSMSQMVSIMPAIPLVDTRSLTAAEPVSTAVDVNNVMKAPLTNAWSEESHCPAICNTTCGCITTAVTAASMAEVKRVMSDGTLRAIMIAVMTGVINVRIEMLNVRPKPSVYSSTRTLPSTENVKPAMIKMMSVMTMDGVVVRIIYLMCVKRLTRDTVAARTVVSLSGLILSPK